VGFFAEPTLDILTTIHFLNRLDLGQTETEGKRISWVVECLLEEIFQEGIFIFFGLPDR